MKRAYRYSPTAYILTVLGLLAILLAGYFLVANPQRTSFDILLAGCILLGLLIPIPFLPRAIEVEEQTIRLYCLAFTKTFTSEDYSVQQVPSDDSHHWIRLFGSGGYFGYTGFFSVPQVGRVRMLLANERLPILRLTERATGRTYFINFYPEDFASEEKLGETVLNR